MAAINVTILTRGYYVLLATHERNRQPPNQTTPRMHFKPQQGGENQWPKSQKAPLSFFLPTNTPSWMRIKSMLAEKIKSCLLRYCCGRLSLRENKEERGGICIKPEFLLQTRVGMSQKRHHFLPDPPPYSLKFEISDSVCLIATSGWTLREDKPVFEALNDGPKFIAPCQNQEAEANRSRIHWSIITLCYNPWWRASQCSFTLRRCCFCKAFRACVSRSGQRNRPDLSVAKTKMELVGRVFWTFVYHFSVHTIHLEWGTMCTF